MNFNKDQWLKSMGIKPDGIKKANVVQGSRGRLMVELWFYDGRFMDFYYRGEPSNLVAPIEGNFFYLNWKRISREEFFAMGPA